MDSKKYASCNVAGDGKLYTESNKNAHKFNIIDMSAEGIRVETSAELHEEMNIKLKIRLKGSPIDAYMDVSGKVIGKQKMGSKLNFLIYWIPTRMI